MTKAPDTSVAVRRSFYREHRGFIAAALFCVAVFGWMLTYGTGRLVADDVFGNFYDYQAQAWLAGRWDVPEPALSGEAFIVDGKVYGYFGPTPAVMRLPLVLAHIGFGRVTRFYMLLDYIGVLVASYLILRSVARQTSHPTPPGWLVSVLMLTGGLGSTLFFLGSRPYVYHEAILCGAAFALWSLWYALRYLNQPSSRAWIGAIVCGVLAVHARPPAGLFALTFIGVVAVRHAWRQRRLAPLGIGAAAALGVFSYNAVSYIKFRTFEGCPLQLNVQYTPERLAALGGRNFHLSNLRFNADSYLFQPSASLRPQFPWVFLEYLNRTRDYPESKMAYRDPTLAIPYAMPALTLLALVGLVIAAFRLPSVREPLGLLWASAVPFSVAMLTAVAVTHRYTADFVPFLIAAGAYGGMGIATCRPDVRRGAALALFAALGISIAVQIATTLHHQRAVVWGAPEWAKVQYENWRGAIDHLTGARP